MHLLMDDKSNYKYDYNHNQLDEQDDSNYEDLNKKCASRIYKSKISHHI